MSEEIKKSHLPYPEIVDDVPEDPYANPWSVYRSEGGIPRASFESKEMWVPDSDSIHDRLIRAHEMGHKISPPEGPEKAVKRRKVSTFSIMAAEDARVNYRIIRGSGELGRLMENEWLRDDHAKTLLNQIAKLREDGNLTVAVQTMVVFASSIQGKYDTIKELPEYKALSVPDRKLIGMIHRKTIASMHRATSFDDAVKLAKFFDKIIEDESKDEKEARKEALKAKEKSKELRESEEDSSATDEAEARKVMKETREEGSSSWGEMSIANVANTISPRSRRAGYGKRRSMMGTKIDLPNLHHIVTDGKIFSARVEKKGGTVLIDGSGSMHWEIEELWELIEAAPHIMVAVYAGAYTTGVLSIVVKDKRSVTKKQIEGGAIKNLCGGNIVDGPALRWLARQRGPRIWVSDEFVTGIHDYHTKDLLKECRGIVRRAGIKRLNDVHDAIPYFRRLYGVVRQL